MQFFYISYLSSIVYIPHLITTEQTQKWKQSFNFKRFSFFFFFLSNKKHKLNRFDEKPNSRNSKFKNKNKIWLAIFWINSPSSFFFNRKCTKLLLSITIALTTTCFPAGDAFSSSSFSYTAHFIDKTVTNLNRKFWSFFSLFVKLFIWFLGLN